MLVTRWEGPVSYARQVRTAEGGGDIEEGGGVVVVSRRNGGRDQYCRGVAFSFLKSGDGVTIGSPSIR